APRSRPRGGAFRGGRGVCRPPLSSGRKSRAALAARRAPDRAGRGGGAGRVARLRGVRRGDRRDAAASPARYDLPARRHARRTGDCAPRRRAPARLRRPGRSDGGVAARNARGRLSGGASMSEMEEIEPEVESRPPGWREKLWAVGASAGRVFETRAAMFQEELAEKGTLLGKALTSLFVAILFGTLA